jgi:cytochrome c2
MTETPKDRRGHQWLWLLIAVAIGMSSPPVARAEPSVASAASAAGEVEGFNAVGPPLTALQSKIGDPNWLVAWLLKPSRLRPHTTMPDSDLTTEEALTAARYLYGTAAAAKGAGQWSGGDARTGEKLFVSRGCRGCHAIARGEASLSRRVPNLADIGIKVRGDWLGDWLKSPRSYNPRTPMPQLVLRDGEVRDLVAFLLTRRDGADAVAAAPHFKPNADPAAGRAVIERYQCASCHEMKGFPAPTPAFELLGDGARQSPDTALRNGRLLVAYYNCRGCHQIEGSRGAIAQHLERKTFAPPTLEGEGARVQASWLRQFIRHPTSLRPWLQIRMPDYGFSDAQADTLVHYFAALAGVPPADEPHAAAAAETVGRGLRRLAHYKCMQCHPTSPEIPKGVDVENLSINFGLVKARLRPSWIRQFLARPKAIAGTQTRMPTVFYTVDGNPKVEHPDEDINALAAYLLQMSEPPEAALAKLAAERESEKKVRSTDWTKYEY